MLAAEKTPSQRVCRNTAVCLLLVIATLAAYWPVQGYGFVNYDDLDYVVDNEHIHAGITWAGIQWALTTGHAANWHPLTWLSHMLDCQLFGPDSPGRHHLTNLALHVINALLLLFLLQRMTGAFWRAAVVAAVFALHPLHVESVAWISERKDVLSSTFWLLHLNAYVQYTRQQNWAWYGLTLLLLALGLMAKPMLVTAPFLLLLLDYWPLGRFDANGTGIAGDSHLTGTPSDPTTKPTKVVRTWLRLIDEKVPMLVIVAISCLVTYLVQRGAMMADPFWHRLATALTAYVRYLGKTLWPANLACFYPNQVGIWQPWQVIGACAVLVSLTSLVVVFRRQRYLTVGWLWYLGTLVPVIGLVKVGLQSMADRYMYMPMTGLAVMIVWGAADLCSRYARGRIVGGLVAAAVIVAYLLLTPVQVRTWKSSFTLFRHAAAVTHGNYVMHNNVGSEYERRGQVEEAVHHYRRSVEIKPDDEMIQCNLAGALRSQGNFEEAIHHYREALRLFPEFDDAHAGLGLAYYEMGKLQPAVRHFRRAVRINRDDANWQNNLGMALAAMGRIDEATVCYRRALQIDPDHARALNGLGATLVAKKEWNAAIDCFRQALRVDPTYEIARRNLMHAEEGLRQATQE